MAKASVVSARKLKMVAAIWWAARVASSTRAATNVVPVSTTSTAATRMARWRPAVRNGASSSRSGRRDAAAARWGRTTHTNAAPASACTTTVLHADPAMPRSKMYTATISRPRFTTLATTTITSGVRRSSMPRSTPCPARATSTKGMPTALMRRYVVATSSTSPLPPSTHASGSAHAARATAIGTPISAHSHSACTPTAAALSAWPPPRWWARRWVVA